jgi:hypothetical protein
MLLGLGGEGEFVGFFQTWNRIVVFKFVGALALITEGCCRVEQKQ